MDSRGGRTYLSGSPSSKKVKAPSLLLVGSKDYTQVIALYQKALQELKDAREKRLVRVSEAGHLFEEMGTLEEAEKHGAFTKDCS